MKDDNNIEQIHRYLSRQMDAHEQESFEKAMEKDDALKQAVLLEQQLLGAIESSFDKEARADIRQVHNQLQGQGFFATSQGRPRRLKVIRIGAIAAAVIIFCGGIWWFALKPATFDPALAFGQHFQPENTMVESIIEDLTSVGFTPEMNQADSLREALKLYRDGHHYRASEALGAFIQDHPQNDTARFYLALAEISLSQYEPATDKLSDVAQAEHSPLAKEAQWYLALCYLQLEGGVEKAWQILETLVGDSGFSKQVEAESILKELRKM